MRSYALGFHDVDQSKYLVVGGKGANLGELCKIDGLLVPNGFCISTEAFARILQDAAGINELLAKLPRTNTDDRADIGNVSCDIRKTIENTPIPDDIRGEIRGFLEQLGENHAYAIRSSATAEDLPTASFAGQQDTYLNIIGEKAIFTHISKCWASLFTERAILYRLQNGFDHHDVRLSVLVQRMVFPKAAGIMFTADPVTCNRKVSSIDASFGLGEALVSGLVNADNYRVQNGRIVDKKISAKKVAIQATQDGGTQRYDVTQAQQNKQALTDAHIVELERLGRKIEAHFGQPQDIEWCLADDAFFIVQSRPITTLYPIPEAHDQENHVYVSVGHQQMMTDPMKPLGLSIWQMTAGRPMFKAGGRLFVDITRELASPVRSKMITDGLGKSDPLIKDALLTIVQRGDFIPALPDEHNAANPGKTKKGPPPPNYQTLVDQDPAIVAELIASSQDAIAAAKRNIQSKSGLDLFDFIREDIGTLRQSSADPRSFAVFMTAINASWWINEKINDWLGEKNVADTLTQSVPNNVTSEMGLALLDVADVLRPLQDVVDYLPHAKDETFWEGLLPLAGGRQAHDAIHAYLDTYGMRGVGEIDITRPRWSEKPTTLVPMILGNIKHFPPGAGKQKFEHGRQEALKKETDLLKRLRQLPDGEQKAHETKRMLDLVRNFIGYREYPKYAIVNRYFVYKQALKQEAKRLVQAKVIREIDDIHYLTFDELRDVVGTNKVDQQLIRKRKDEHKSFEKLRPPRVITSDGEVISGAYKRDNLPAEAIVGLAVSAGIVEGRARVISTLEHANLEDGDILITSFTDPSWTPLFVSIKGLVTEVGGLMTHGAVIAREYGLPAVVGVENATKRIKDGQRIRVNGTDGYIECI